MKKILATLMFLLIPSLVFGQALLGPATRIAVDDISDEHGDIKKYCAYHYASAGGYVLNSVDQANTNIVACIDADPNAAEKIRVVVDPSTLNMTEGQQSYFAMTSVDEAGNESAVNNEVHVVWDSVNSVVTGVILNLQIQYP